MRRPLMLAAGLSVMLQGSAAAQRRDSAGVEIVTSSAAALTRRLPWRVDSRALLEVGHGAQTAFGSVAGGVLLPDGGFAVLDGLNRELRVFSPDGRTVRTAGGRGQGPGEFQTPSLSPALYGDSIPVADMLGRVSLFTSTGNFARSVEARAQIGSARGVVGRMLVTTRATGFGPASQEGWHRTSYAVDLIDLANGNRRTLLNLPGPMTLFAVLGGTDAMTDPRRRPKVRILPAPMTAQPTVVAASNHLWSTDGTSYRIVSRNEGGSLQRILRVDAAPPAMRSDLLRAEKQKILDAEEIPELKRTLRTFMDKAPPQSRQAAFDALVVDTDAGVWARLYDAAPAAVRTWVVFDQHGIARGTVDVPSRLELLNVLGSRVLARTTDDDDVQTVVVARLSRPADAR